MKKEKRRAHYRKAEKGARAFADRHAAGVDLAWRESWAFLHMGYKAGYRAALSRSKKRKGKT